MQHILTWPCRDFSLPFGLTFWFISFELKYLFPWIWMFQTIFHSWIKIVPRILKYNFKPYTLDLVSTPFFISPQVNLEKSLVLLWFICKLWSLALLGLRSRWGATQKPNHFHPFLYKYFRTKWFPEDPWSQLWDYRNKFSHWRRAVLQLVAVVPK